MQNEKEKTTNNITEIVFILDKSGSMAGLEKDTIGGFNSMIEKQKQVEGTAFVTTTLFSNNNYKLHDRVPLSEIKPLTENDYYVGGGTALLDAVGDTIKHINFIHKYIRKEDVPSKTIFIITTEPDDVYNIQEDLKNAGYDILSAEKTKQASTSVTLDNEDDIKFMNLLIEKLEEDDDVMDVYHNWENCD